MIPNLGLEGFDFLRRNVGWVGNDQIECDVAGRIRAVLVKNGDPVEFGQPLFIIE